MAREQTIFRTKVGLPELARQLGNASRRCIAQRLSRITRSPTCHCWCQVRVPRSSACPHSTSRSASDASGVSPFTQVFGLRL